MKQKTVPFVDILIVSYNGKYFLPACLASLQELNYPKECYCITVIDNASSDDTISSINQNIKHTIHIIQNRRNIGFGKANNIGIKATNTQTKYIVLLNQDSLVDSEWLTELVDVMEKNTKAGACGATQKDYTLYKKIKSGEKKTKECVWMGCGSIILRKKALDEIGYFDQYYFMYIEDIDLTWRLKISGWKILHTYNALWFHEGRHRKLTYNNKRLYWAWKNRIYLIIKFGSWNQIKRSFLFYYSLLRRKQHPPHQQIENKDNANEQNEKTKSAELRKILFLTKIFFSIPSIIFYALATRKRLCNNFSFDAEEVDSWIRYVDHVLIED